MTPFAWDRFEAMPIVAIVRGLDPARLSPLVRAVVEGGLTTLEITMNSPDARGQIQAAQECAGGALNIGAGTVTDLRLLNTALGAGASFIVTPTIQPAVISECARLGVPVFPGAMSPTEVAAAWELGASLVKIFPADRGGPSHLEHLLKAMPELRLMPTGGVDLDSLRAYHAAGAAAFGIGSPLFDKALLEAGDWNGLRDRCRRFCAAFMEASSSRNPRRRDGGVED